MPVQTLKLAGKRYVLMKEADYKRLTVKPKANRKSRSTARDRGDVAESARRMKEPGGTSLAAVRKRLGL